MITSPQILTYSKAQPFRPFRLHMASGKTYDVRHPEMIKVLKNYLLVFSFSPDDPELPEIHETVSMVLIESISHLDVPATAT